MRDGELYVAGRIKDVIVVRGRKLHPLTGDGLEESIALLPQLADLAPRRRLAVEEWDGVPVTATDGAELLRDAGFSSGPRVMTYRTPL